MNIEANDSSVSIKMIICLSFTFYYSEFQIYMKVEAHSFPVIFLLSLFSMFFKIFAVRVLKEIHASYQFFFLIFFF